MAFWTFKMANSFVFAEANFIAHVTIFTQNILPKMSVILMSVLCCISLCVCSWWMQWTHWTGMFSISCMFSSWSSGAVRDTSSVTLAHAASTSVGHTHTRICENTSTAHTHTHILYAYTLLHHSARHPAQSLQHTDWYMCQTHIHTFPSERTKAKDNMEFHIFIIIILTWSLALPCFLSSLFYMQT